jgi:hypothetical protein
MDTKRPGKSASTKTQTMRKVARCEVVECCCGMAKFVVEQC